MQQRYESKDIYISCKTLTGNIFHHDDNFYYETLSKLNVNTL